MNPAQCPWTANFHLKYFSEIFAGLLTHFLTERVALVMTEEAVKMVDYTRIGIEAKVVIGLAFSSAVYPSPIFILTHCSLL
jgi:hypothetical protein